MIWDVQIGSIIDQCTGAAAKKVIAKHWIDIITGNVNSYARVLNGPHQLDKIQTYNELAATMAVLKKEKEQQQEEQCEEMKHEEKVKAAQRAKKEWDAIARAAELGPICQAHVDKGIDHVLSLKLPEKDILLYNFGLATVDISNVSKLVYKLTLVDTATVLSGLMVSKNHGAEDGDGAVAAM